MKIDIFVLGSLEKKVITLFKSLVANTNNLNIVINKFNYEEESSLISFFVLDKTLEVTTIVLHWY